MTVHQSAIPPVHLLLAVLFLLLIAPWPVKGESPATGPALDTGLSKVELADDDGELRRGLMFREELCEYCGMLFVYPRARVLSFWMKNTLLPLDMIFLDEKGVITTIHRDTEPFREWPLYRSEGPAKYVLEVNAGYGGRRGLEEGLRIDLDSLRKVLVDYRWEGAVRRGE